MESLGNNSQPRRNRLLGSLSLEDFETLLPTFEIKSIQPKEMVYESNKPITSVYFPLNGVLSILAVVGDAQIEVVEVGNEGMIGIPAFLGSTTTPTLCFAQFPGDSVLMAVETFRDQLRARPGFYNVMRSYTLAILNQISQLVACNRYHNMTQRLARWLLMTHDRVGADQFRLTQELIARMLGVRRATATEAAQALQGAGLISYNRGIIRIVNRPGLVEAACRCYRIIVDDFERLVPGGRHEIQA